MVTFSPPTVTIPNGVTAGTVYVAAIGENKYTSLQAAIEAAKRNATVTLLADTRENVTIDKAMTLDLNGHTPNGGTGKGQARTDDHCTHRDDQGLQRGADRHDHA